MSLAISGRDLVTRSLRTVGAYAALDVPSGEDLQVGFQLLNEVIDSWNIQALTVTLIGRSVYDLVSGKGGPENPYTIGPGGNFDTGTAARPDTLYTANLLLNTASDYPTEIPLAILTDDMYAANPIKSILNAQPSTLYYSRSVPLGSIQLWNIPNTDANQLVLYYAQLTPAFADYSTLYVCPPGYQKAFRLCLAEAMIMEFSVTPAIAQQIRLDAAVALADVKTSNAAAMMADLAIDPAFTMNSQGTYVIQTDQGA